VKFRAVWASGWVGRTKGSADPLLALLAPIFLLWIDMWALVTVTSILGQTHIHKLDFWASEASRPLLLILVINDKH
jgi:hypothetical protein